MTNLTEESRAVAHAAQLAEPALNEQTQIAFFGVWNAGKSTVIKRLLVELALPIPDWLTVSGAPETNFVGEVQLNEDLMLLDTPGISAGMSLHEGEAASALQRADVVVVLLLPALLTAEKDEILGILRGVHVHPDGWPWVPDSLRVLVTQLDQGGLDPVADATNFKDYAGRKLQEFDAILKARGIVLPQPPGLVIADLNAEVSDDREDLTLEDYRRGPWDGIEGLLDWLQALPHQRLRELGSARRLAKAAASRAALGRRAARVAEARVDALQVEVAGLEDQRSELLAQVDEARNDLREALEGFAASIYSGDLTEAPEALVERQREVIDGWLGRHQQRFDDLRLDLSLDADALRQGQSSDPWKLFDTLTSDPDLAEQARKLIGEIFGTEFARLREELQKTVDDDYWKDAARTLRTEAHAKAAQGVLVAGASVSVLIELAGMVRQLTEDPTPEHERRVAELRDRVRATNDEAVEQAIAILSRYAETIAVPLNADIEQREALIGQAQTGIAEKVAEADDIERRIEILRHAAGGI